MSSSYSKSSPLQKRIFITGAAGYIGGTITKLATAQGYSVHGLSRSESGDAKLLALGATPIRGDLSTLEVLRKESSEADIIIHCAFIHDFTANYEDILRTDAAAVDALASPLIGTSRPLIISSGSALVQPDPNGGETDETAPLQEKPPIDRWKSEAHALSWNQKGVHVNAVRLPPYVYGRGGKGFLAMLIQMAVKAGESLYIDMGANRTSCTYVDDAAKLYLLVAEKAGAGEIFNAVGSTAVSSKDMASAIGDVLEVPVRSLPREEVVKKWGPFLPLVVGNETRASSRKAKEMLGWEPTGPGILEEVKEGSYREMALQLKKEGAGEAFVRV